MYGRIIPCPSGWSVAALGSLVLALSLAADGGVSQTALAVEPDPAAAPTAAPAAGTAGKAQIEVSSVTIRPDGPAVPGAPGAAGSGRWGRPVNTLPLGTN